MSPPGPSTTSLNGDPTSVCEKAYSVVNTPAVLRRNTVPRPQDPPEGRAVEIAVGCLDQRRLRIAAVGRAVKRVDARQAAREVEPEGRPAPVVAAARGYAVQHSVGCLDQATGRKCRAGSWAKHERGRNPPQKPAENTVPLFPGPRSKPSREAVRRPRAARRSARIRLLRATSRGVSRSRRAVQVESKQRPSPVGLERPVP